MMVRYAGAYLSCGTFADRTFVFVDHGTFSPADITYASLATAFNQPLVHHAETLRRMAELGRNRSWIHTQNKEQRRARERMALFPANAEALFVARDIWVVSNHFDPSSFTDTGRLTRFLPPSHLFPPSPPFISRSYGWKGNSASFQAYRACFKGC
jgi:hypothetical protein